MTRIAKSTLLFLGVGALVAGLVGSSEASTISVLPSKQKIVPGGTASVDIVLSQLGAGETVGGFSFLLSFDSAVVGTPDSFVANPDSKMGPSPLDLSPGFAGAGGSPLSLFYLADASISQADLKTLEGTGFRLATVSFTGLFEGLSALMLGITAPNGAFLANYEGLFVLPATVVNGSICVDDPATSRDPCPEVPEPATLPLLGAGLAVFVMYRWRQARSPL